MHRGRSVQLHGAVTEGHSIADPIYLSCFSSKWFTERSVKRSYCTLIIISSSGVHFLALSFSPWKSNSFTRDDRVIFGAPSRPACHDIRPVNLPSPFRSIERAVSAPGPVFHFLASSQWVGASKRRAYCSTLSKTMWSSLRHREIEHAIFQEWDHVDHGCSIIVMISYGGVLRNSAVRFPAVAKKSSLRIARKNCLIRCTFTPSVEYSRTVLLVSFTSAEGMWKTTVQTNSWGFFFLLVSSRSFRLDPQCYQWTAWIVALAKTCFCCEPSWIWTGIIFSAQMLCLFNFFSPLLIESGCSQSLNRSLTGAICPRAAEFRCRVEVLI